MGYNIMCCAIKENESYWLADAGLQIGIYVVKETFYVREFQKNHIYERAEHEK